MSADDCGGSQPPRRVRALPRGVRPRRRAEEALRRSCSCETAPGPCGCRSCSASPWCAWSPTAERTETPNETTRYAVRRTGCFCVALRRWACGRGWPCCPCASGACGRACSWGAFRREMCPLGDAYVGLGLRMIVAHGCACETRPVGSPPSRTGRPPLKGNPCAPSAPPSPPPPWPPSPWSRPPRPSRHPPPGRRLRTGRLRRCLRTRRLHRCLRTRRLHRCLRTRRLHRCLRTRRLRRPHRPDRDGLPDGALRRTGLRIHRRTPRCVRDSTCPAPAVHGPDVRL